MDGLNKVVFPLTKNGAKRLARLKLQGEVFGNMVDMSYALATQGVFRLIDGLERLGASFKSISGFSSDKNITIYFDDETYALLENYRLEHGDIKLAQIKTFIANMAEAGCGKYESMGNRDSPKPTTPPFNVWIHRD